MKTRKRPFSARVLSQWVDVYAREHDQPPARVRNWISHMILGGALERAGFDGAGRKFSIKGGVALEMRLRDRARATKDLDLVLLAGGDLIQELTSALATPYEGFSFRLRGSGHVMPNGAARVEVALDYLGKSWGTVQVDVGPQEGGGAEVDMVEAISLAPFGLDGPGSLPCLSLPYHVAQKIHAMTAPPPEGKRNDRFRDLVDLLLMREWITDFEAVRSACRDVFQTRGTHAWPPFFTAPDHWTEQYASMAAGFGLNVTDVHQAAFEARVFIACIDETAEVVSSIEIAGPLNATSWYWVVSADGSVWRIPAGIGEALYMHNLPDETEILEEWKRTPGGIALIGAVVVLRDRRPLYVERVGARGIPLTRDSVGQPVEFTPAVWATLAEAILRVAKAPMRAIEGFAVFLSYAEGILPCVLANELGVTSRDAHKHFVRYWRPDTSGPPMWDLWSSQPVQRVAQQAA